MTSCWKIVTPLTFFQFTANLKQSGRQTSETQSIKLVFSLIVTFYLTKTENRTKKSLTQLSHYCFVKVLFQPQNADFLDKKKNADISKIKRILVLKGIFSETTYRCVLTCQISSFQHNSNEFQTGGTRLIKKIIPPDKRLDIITLGLLFFR